jgi:pyruvate, water dikinase
MEAMTLVALADALDERTYGGKASQLAAAVRAELPVPEGVAVSVESVSEIVAGERAAIASLQEAFAALGAPVAARSSAIGEDSKQASFAGQHVTHLAIWTADELVRALADIARSAHSEHALAYRKKLSLEGAPQIAAVVQRMVDADRAGVMFTRNPMTGADERLIEASWGLGEAVVAGLVTPDRFRIARSGEILERTAGEKDLAIRMTPRGTERIAIERERRGTLCLGDAELRALHELGARCEALIGESLDIEFAFARDRLFLLQARAITR